MKRKYKFI